jgi:outer membrane protein OmpA-like peptidoglycan-associated protein
VPGAAAPQAVPAEQRETLATLRQELAATGVTVSDTPEGHLKVSIPGDTSFGLGRTTVGPAFGRLLNSMADALNKHPNTAIEIVGHTDATGTDAVNLVVSKRRADSTRDYLVSRNVAADRIKTQGWGSDQPVADNNTAQGRAANRRVEIFVSER